MAKQELYKKLFGSITMMKRMVDQSIHSLPIDSTFTNNQFQALLFIKEKPNATVGELAGHLRISLSSAAQLTDRLDKQSCIVRHSDPKDRRIVRLSLTDAGEQEFIKNYSQVIGIMGDLFVELSEKELNDLFSIHQKLIKKLESRKNKERS